MTLMRAAVASLAAWVTLVAGSGGAMADPPALAAPRALVAPAVPRAVLGGDFFAARGILDLREVQQHPVMRARREYAVLASLPMISPLASPLAFLTQTQTWKVSRSVLFTFPLAITGRNLFTAEIAHAGQVAVMPTGLASGGVCTFTGAF